MHDINDNKTIWYGMVINPTNEYDILYLNSDSTYTYSSAYIFPWGDSWGGKLIKYKRTGIWHKLKNYLYLERSDINLSEQISNDGSTNLQFYLITDSVSIPYQMAEIKIYRGNSCFSYYTDENGCIKFPASFKADFVSVGVPSREFVYKSGMDITVYMTSIISDNICSLWEYHGGILKHPINKRYKLYNHNKHPKIKLPPAGVE